MNHVFQYEDPDEIVYFLVFNCGNTFLTSRYNLHFTLLTLKMGKNYSVPVTHVLSFVVFALILP